MIWDVNLQTYEEPYANERKHAMGFLIGTTITYNLNEEQYCFF